MAFSRPTKPVFTLHTNEGFTEPVEPELLEFDDDVVLLSLYWDENDSYSSACREQFAPMAFGEDRFYR